MGAREASNADQERRDIERYREAANLAVEQLYLLVKYFTRIRKPGIADVFEQNRQTIVKRYRL